MGTTSGHVTVVGWIAFLAGVYLISKTDTGYKVIYYSLVLILLLLVVGNYKTLTGVLITQN